ncbi:MAG: MFS transporter [Patescibacteria group bacterium]
MFKDAPKLKNIFLAGFLLSLHLAFTAYINSSFLTSFVGEKLINLIYALGAIASILVLLVAPEILQKIGIRKFLLSLAFIDALSLLTFSSINNSCIAAIIFILYFVTNILIIFSIDELLKIFSKNSATGKVRGLYIAVMNLAWIIAQLASSKILGAFHFQTIYFIGFTIMLLFFLTVLFGLKNIPNPNYDKMKIIKYVETFFKDSHLSRSYKINFLLQFFISWMIIYTPIYLSVHLGFTWQQIGIIFAIMLIPFSILPFRLGEYADKIGERKMLMIGFFIASIATMSIFFIHQHAIWIWALALFMTRVGGATIETMSDVYFFKHIKPENEEYISVYRNTLPIAYIVGPLSALIAFAFIPSFNFLYIILGAIMLSGVYIASTISRSDI